jgi:hypothetical protein
VTALNKDAALFAAGVARATGLKPDVVAAWVQAEGNGGGTNNWLNVRPGVGKTKGFSGVPITASSSGFANFSSVDDAVKETAYWINLMGNYGGIKAARKSSAGAQITAIASSPWDAGHYAAGGKRGQGLLNAYNSVIKTVGGGMLHNTETAYKILGGHGGSSVSAATIGGDILHPGRTAQKAATGVENAATSVATGAVSKILKAVVGFVVLALAALLFYQGVRRISGDALPSSGQIAGAGAKLAAA